MWYSFQKNLKMPTGGPNFGKSQDTQTLNVQRTGISCIWIYLARPMSTGRLVIHTTRKHPKSKITTLVKAHSCTYTNNQSFSPNPLSSKSRRSGVKPLRIAVTETSTLAGISGAELDIQRRDIKRSYRIKNIGGMNCTPAANWRPLASTM